MQIRQKLRCSVTNCCSRLGVGVVEYDSQLEVIMSNEQSGDGTSRPYPAREGRLPRRLEELSPEWLTGLLANRYPGIVVQDYEVVQVTNSHTTKLRLALDLNEVGRAAGIPSQVCLKANWSIGVHTGDICEQEARFYHLMRDDIDAPIPHSYYADWDGDGGGRGIVVMEDLAVAPGAFGLSTDHLGVDGIAKGLETLATVHGALWGSHRLEEQQWLPQSMGTSVDTEQVIQLWNYLEFNLKDPDYQAVLPTWVVETPEKLNHLLDELSAYEREQTGPKCLVHGDAHQGNSFLRANGERVWVDWQLVRKGTPWRDVSYFVIGGLTVEERQASAWDLVRHYRELLIATGAEGVPDQDAAWEHFRRWPAYGMQSWLSNINHWGQTSGLEMARRNHAAAEDFDTVKLLTGGRRPRRQVTLGEGAGKLTLGQ
jgi:hypothetical protein